MEYTVKVDDDGVKLYIYKIPFTVIRDIRDTFTAIVYEMTYNTTIVHVPMEFTVEASEELTTEAYTLLVDGTKQIAREEPDTLCTIKDAELIARKRMLDAYTI